MMHISNELWMHILSYTDRSSLGKISQTCRFFNHLNKKKYFKKYISWVLVNGTSKCHMVLNEKHGPFELKSKVRTITGNYKCNKKIGLWKHDTSVFSLGLLYDLEGNQKTSVLHHKENGYIRSIEYKSQGVRQGTFKVEDVTTKELLCLGEYFNNELVGQWMFWYPRTTNEIVVQRRCYGTYQNSKKHGWWRYYYTSYIVFAFYSMGDPTRRWIIKYRDGGCVLPDPSIGKTFLHEEDRVDIPVYAYID
jgi:hypothetical protein